MRCGCVYVLWRWGQNRPVVSGVEDFASLLGGDRGFERSVARRQSFRGASLLLSVAAFLELPGGVTNVYRAGRLDRLG